MGDDLADNGRLRLLPAASSEKHRRRERARDCSDAPPAPKHWRYVQQNLLLSSQRDDARTRDDREMIKDDPTDKTMKPRAAKPEPTPETAITSWRGFALTNVSSGRHT
jgi:hypothetical protein